MEPHSSQQTQQPKTDQLQPDINSFDEYFNQLPKETRLGSEMIHHQGFWIWSRFLRRILSFQTHFEAQPTDIFITGMPKTGNTWLKSLVFSTLHRHHHPISNSPVLHHNPHELVPPLAIVAYDNNPTPNVDQCLIYQGQPRLLATHLPYQALPQSIIASGCRIIYICRNPLDTFVSSWFFFKRVVETMGSDKFPTMEEYFELYLQGLTPFGPFFEHVLGYWKKNFQMPDKMLFLKYEELLEDPTSQLKKIAKFINQPFSLKEEQVGVIEEIIKLCSIKNLKELKVNKEGRFRNAYENHIFFRKGEKGDGTNHLTPSMVDRMRELMRQKVDGLDLPVQGWL